MAVQVRGKARLSAPADGRVKSEIHQHSAYAPVAQWIEHEPTDLGVGGSSPSGRTIKQQVTMYDRSEVLPSSGGLGLWLLRFLGEAEQ